MPNPKFNNIITFIKNENFFIQKIHHYTKRLKIHDLEEKYKKSFGL